MAAKYQQPKKPQTKKARQIKTLVSVHTRLETKGRKYKVEASVWPVFVKERKAKPGCQTGKVHEKSFRQNLKLRQR